MMVRTHYPYLLQQRRRWFVRMVVPADVRGIIGRSIFKVPTGHTDEHRAATVAATIITELHVGFQHETDDIGGQTGEQALNLVQAEIRSEWNYTIAPNQQPPCCDQSREIAACSAHSEQGRAHLSRRVAGRHAAARPPDEPGNFQDVNRDGQTEDHEDRRRFSEAISR
jgi:hypothetical protein